MNGFRKYLNTFSLTAALCLTTFSLSAAAPRKESRDSGTNTSGASTFGFTGPETYPIDPFISQLRAADLDGDGLNDLIIVNNSRSKITLLYNQTGKTNIPAPRFGVKPELNELPPDARFRIDSIASEKRIAAIVVADLNGDKRPDIAYYGEPKELVVQYNQGSNGWSSPKRWAIDDGQLTPNALSSGDLNGDGRTDLLLLGENTLYWFRQDEDKSLGEPIKIPYSGAVKSAQLLDIDGDGRDDLLLVNWDSPNPFRFRLQNASGQLGPEIHFALPPIRSYWADDLDGDHKTEMITIAQNSGRAQISNFVKKPAEPLAGDFKQGQFQVLPLNKTTKARRGIAWADVDGDHLPDLLVAEPDVGQLTVYLQQKDGALSQAKTFSTLTGVTDLEVVEASDGSPAEIYLMSPDERQIGLTHYDKQGRIAFPTIIPMDGRPLAMAVGSLKPKAKPTLALILDQDGKRVLMNRSADGKTKTQKLSESFKSNPSSLAFHDANQDGLADLIVLIPYEKIKVLIQVPDKNFDEQDIAAPGGSTEQPWMAISDVDGDGKPELLLAQKNFLRAVVLKADGEKDSTNKTWTFLVKDQINGMALNSRIVGATAVRNGTNAVASLFMLDAERKSLTVSERNTNGAWQVVRNILLPFTEFNELQPLSIGAKGANSVAFIGANAVAWMPLGGDVWDLVELDGYETPIKDGQLHDVVSGDLNQDGRKDLVFLETAKNYLDLVIFDANRKLVPATRWQVFEERTFRGRRGDQPEPREALIVDVTGDKKNDLVVVVHDRILVYPQE
ncbi:MAG TPA: VCBS repeat-containing protein [Verrucomicrobiae bacterium]|nr:VCBS repeat-containing protein [Verrucomicrobiae bacterium]